MHINSHSKRRCGAETGTMVAHRTRSSSRGYSVFSFRHLGSLTITLSITPLRMLDTQNRCVGYKHLIDRYCNDSFLDFVLTNPSKMFLGKVRTGYNTRVCTRTRRLGMLGTGADTPRKCQIREARTSILYLGTIGVDLNIFSSFRYTRRQNTRVKV